MRFNWVPLSAAALVAGAMSLMVGSLFLPRLGSSDPVERLRVVEMNDGRWLGVSVLMFLAAVLLTAGLPVILTLFELRGTKLGFTAVGMFAIGCIGLAGFAMLIAFYKALAEHHAIVPTALEPALEDPWLRGFLYTWVATFYAGEVLLAIALLVARTVSVWIPALLIGHVVLRPVSRVLPDEVASMTIILTALALSGIAITANNIDVRVTSSRAVSGRV